MNDEPLFRVIFNQNSKIYEIYARSVTDETMVGFVLVEELVFGEEGALVIDPSEEKLRQEFKDVESLYIPLHHIIRIDEVAEEGTPKIREGNKDGSNVSTLPITNIRRNQDADV